MEILILPVNECHLEQCACCEKNESEAWSLKQLEEEFNSPFGKLFVALAETSVVGVAVFQFTGFEASLATVTVMPQYRQKGIAKRLLCESMQSLEKEGA
ncbi:MAG: GNAT family N-acetyltransferase, partial [Oscillospiraceae bacterium]